MTMTAGGLLPPTSMGTRPARTPFWRRLLEVLEILVILGLFVPLMIAVTAFETGRLRQPFKEREPRS